jgi:hypothetical protein
MPFKFERDSVISAATHLTAIRDGGITELRLLEAVTDVNQRPHVESGYFSDAITLADALRRIRCCKGAYIIPNQVDRRLLARAANRLRSVGRDPLTGDGDITGRDWLLLDFDPVRPSGISATDAEKAKALVVARSCREWLHDEGWPEPVLGDSGNGAHLMYALSLPADDGGLVQKCIIAVAEKFDSTTVTVDRTVFNASRIWKLPGTLSCKGDPTEDRPHRIATIIDLPSNLRERLVTLDQLEALGGTAACNPRSTDAPTKSQRFDLTEWIASHNMDVSEERQWQGAGKRWVLRVCPWNPAHTDRSAYIVQRPDGKIGAGCHHNGCANKGWHDLRDLVEPGWRARKPTFVGSDSFVGTQSSQSPSAWPPPRPLPPDIPAVEPFDLALLPESLRAWVEDIALRTQAPIDYSAVAAMVALACVVGRRIGIRPKKHDDWTVVPNLWAAIIGRPGVMKSVAIQEPLKAIRRLEIAAKNCFGEQVTEYKALQMVAVAKHKAAETELKKVVKQGDEKAAAIARKALEQTPEVPVRKRYLVNDSSVEKLGEILSGNPQGVLVYRDELIGLLKSLDKEGQEGSRAFYLEAWNGDGRFTYDRIGRGTVDIEALCVSLIGSIQPGPLGEYLRCAVNSGKGDDGLMQRFQLSVWPDVARTFQNVDRWPNKDAKNRAFALLEDLDGLDPKLIGARTDEHGNGVPFFRFASDAQVVFDEWRINLENKLRGNEEHPAIEAHLAKYRSLIPSLALLIHLADNGTGPVSRDALERSIRWGTYLESHARRIFAPAALSGACGARMLANKILDGAVVDGFSLRSVYMHNWSGLGTRDAAAEAVDVLIDAEWLREEKEQHTGGAPKTSYRINPAIFSKLPGRTGDGDPVTNIPATSMNQQNQQNLQKPPFEGFVGFAGSEKGGSIAADTEVGTWTS